MTPDYADLDEQTLAELESEVEAGHKTKKNGAQKAKDYTKKGKQT